MSKQILIDYGIITKNIINNEDSMYILKISKWLLQWKHRVDNILYKNANIYKRSKEYTELNLRICRLPLEKYIELVKLIASLEWHEEGLRNYSKLQLALCTPSSAPADSTNQGSKYLEKKKKRIPECSRKQDLNLPDEGTVPYPCEWSDV